MAALVLSGAPSKTVKCAGRGGDLESSAPAQLYWAAYREHRATKGPCLWDLRDDPHGSWLVLVCAPGLYQSCVQPCVGAASVYAGAPLVYMRAAVRGWQRLRQGRAPDGTLFVRKRRGPQAGAKVKMI